MLLKNEGLLYKTCFCLAMYFIFAIVKAYFYALHASAHIRLSIMKWQISSKAGYCQHDATACPKQEVVMSKSSINGFVGMFNTNIWFTITSEVQYSTNT